MKFIKVKSEVPLAPVETYLFNSQLVEYDEGHLLLAPIRCRRNALVRKYIQSIVGKNKDIKKSDTSI